MKYSSRSNNFSRLTKILGLILCAYSVNAYAQNIDLENMHVSAISSDAMSMVATRQAKQALPGAPAMATTMAAGQNNALQLPVDAASIETGAANGAITAAVADGVTTSLALSSGAIEMNPLISTSPLGLVAITGMKIGLAKYAETLPEDDKRLTLKTSSALWGGAAVNNMMVLFAAPPPLPLIAGVLMGIATWVHMDTQYQENDKLAAARAAQTLANAEKEKQLDTAQAATATADAEETQAAQSQAAPAATIVTAEAQVASSMEAAPSLAQEFGSSGE